MSKRISKTSKAGLIFPVPRIHRYLKNSTKKFRLTRLVPVYVAAVMEYLCAEILELAGIAAKETKRKRIIPRHILVIVSMDEELRELLKSVIIPQGGVLPHIHPQLLKNQEKTLAVKGSQPYSFFLSPKSKDSKSKRKIKTLQPEAGTTVSKFSIFNAKAKEPRMFRTVPDIRTLWEKQMYLGPKLTLVGGSFLKMSADAIINPTDADLHMNSFIGHLLKSAGGEELMQKIQELRSSHGPLKPLDAMISSSPNTSIKYIIHCFGPRSKDEEPAKKLDELMEKCLSIADGKNLKSLAIPILEMSYLPDEQATHVVLRTITNYFLSITYTSLAQLYLILHDSCRCASCERVSAVLKDLYKE